MDSASLKGLVILRKFFFKSPEPVSSAVEFLCIMDMGYGVSRVIGYGVVPQLVRPKAQSPIRLIEAGSYSFKGGTHCMRLPACHK